MSAPQKLIVTLQSNQLRPRANARALLKPSSSTDLASMLCAQNIHKIFDVDAIADLERKLERRYSKQSSDGGSLIVMTNLRLAIDCEAAMTCAQQDAMVLSARAVQSCSALNRVLIMSLTLLPNTAALQARHLYLHAQPIAAQTRFGFSNPLAFGRKQAVPSELRADDAERARVALLAGQRALPDLFAARLTNQPVIAKLLAQDRLAAAPSVPGGDAESDDNAAAPAAAPIDLLIIEQNERRWQWLAAMLETGSYSVECCVQGPFDSGKLLAASRQTLLAIDLQADPEEIVASDEAPAQRQWPYLLTVPFRLLKQQQAPEATASPEPTLFESADTNQSAVTDSVQSFAASEDAFVDVQSESTEVPAPEVSSAEPEQLFYEPLRDFARRIDPAHLTLYELETYARERLHWHITRAVECDTDRPRRREARPELEYPTRSGAKRSLLRRLGDGATERESLHEAIGAGILALVAAPSQELRDSLLFFEALSIEALHAAWSERETIEAMVNSRLALIERFWELCGPVSYAGTSASATERVLASIARDWQHSVARMPK